MGKFSAYLEIKGTSVIKKSGKTSEREAKNDSAVVSQNPKAAVSTIPVVKNVNCTGRWLYLEDFV